MFKPVGVISSQVHDLHSKLMRLGISDDDENGRLFQPAAPEIDGDGASKLLRETLAANAAMRAAVANFFGAVEAAPEVAPWWETTAVQAAVLSLRNAVRS